MTPEPRDVGNKNSRAASALATQVAGAHVMDDEELLACWEAGLLSDAARRQIVDHLAECSSCCEGLVDQLGRGTLRLPTAHPTETSRAADPDDAWPERPERLPLVSPPVARVAQAAGRRPPAWAWAGMSLAASLLIAVSMLSVFWTGSDNWSAAQRAFAAGDAKTAFTLACQLVETTPAGARRRQAGDLAAAAGERLAQEALLAGRFSDVAAICARLRGQIDLSAALENLRLQAEQRVPALDTLAQAGSLVDYGYSLAGDGGSKQLQFDQPTIARRAAFQQALTEHPEDIRLRLNYGQLLLDTGLSADAAARFRDVVRQDPDNALAWIGQGIAAYQQKQFAAAAAAFEAAIRLNPNSLAAQTNAAMSLEQLGRRGEARQHWRAALALARQEPGKSQIEARLNALEE